jgi:hypothetical protein
MPDPQTASPTNEDRTQPEFDRRRGPRRAGSLADSEINGERRQSDRRKKKPGFAGLLGALFGAGRKDDDTGI